MKLELLAYPQTLGPANLPFTKAYDSFRPIT